MRIDLPPTVRLLAIGSWGDGDLGAANGLLSECYVGRQQLIVGDDRENNRAANGKKSSV